MSKSIKLNNEAVKQVLALKKDPTTVYTLQLAQAKQALKMFKNDPAATARVRAIIAKIEATYKESKEHTNPAAKWPFPTTKRNLSGERV